MIPTLTRRILEKKKNKHPSLNLKSTSTTMTFSTIIITLLCRRVVIRVQTTFSRCARADTNWHCWPTRRTKIAMESHRRRRRHWGGDRINIGGGSHSRTSVRSWGRTAPTWPRCVNSFWPPTTYGRISFASSRDRRLLNVVQVFQVLMRSILLS